MRIQTKETGRTKKGDYCMYKWKLEIILNSGKEITAYYNGNEMTSTDVMNEVLVKHSCTFYGVSNKNRTAEIYIKIADVLVISISAAEDEK
jgi:hypothetical protein